MLRYFISSLIAVVMSSLPTVAQEAPCQPSHGGGNYCVLTMDHPCQPENDPEALELYRRGLAYARRGDAHQAFGDFNKALELEPELDLAY